MNVSRFVLASLLVACSSNGGGQPTDANAITDGLPMIDGGPMIDAPSLDGGPTIDAPPLPACDTVPGDRVVTGGEVVTTCLSSDADIDKFHFTAPASNLAGGTLRFQLDFTECELTFEVHIDADAQFPWARANQSTTITDPSQLEHYFIGNVAPGSAYTLTVKKRVPFSGTCGYTLRTTFTPLNDPYEPNQEPADYKQITVGQNVAGYMACVSPERAVYISDHCDDSFTANLPIGRYSVNYNLTDFANMNPCFSVFCRDESVTPNVTTHSQNDCHPSTSSSHLFTGSFNLTRASKCYIHLDGSSAGVIMSAYTSKTSPSNLRGTNTPYSLVITAVPN